MRYYELLTEIKGKKRKKKRKSKPAYGGYWYPGFAFAGDISGNTGGGEGGGESIHEGEVVSLRARKTPIVVANTPEEFGAGANDVDIILKDLRTNKIVGRVLGNDNPAQYELWIYPRGMDLAVDNLNYVAYGDPRYWEGEEAKHSILAVVGPSNEKIEKSKGPGNTTKLRPDEWDVINHWAKGRTYYGLELEHVSDDDYWTFIEKNLGKVMDLDDAWEDGFVNSDDDGRTFYFTDKLTEDKKQMSTNITSEVRKFTKWACDRLSIKNPPKIELSYDTEEAQEGHHTGRHVEGSGSVWVYANNRNLVDILRTVFHELVHVRQSELGMIDDGDSYPGSPIEAMADMLAGKYLKIYGKNNRKVFQ
jgi:hypothetical protein